MTNGVREKDKDSELTVRFKQLSGLLFIEKVICMAHKPYIPLTNDEQQAKANEIARKFCPNSNCNHDYPSCRKCWVYLIMNEMIGEDFFSNPLDGEEEPIECGNQQMRR